MSAALRRHQLLPLAAAAIIVAIVALSGRAGLFAATAGGDRPGMIAGATLSQP